MGKILVDIGASAYPLEAHGKYVKGDQLYLFEPLPEFYEWLCDKYRKDKNVHIFDMALSDKKGETTLYKITHKPECSCILKPNSESVILRKRADLREWSEITVKMDTLDNVLGHLDRIDYLKLDTEGNEYDILVGAKELLKKTIHIKCEANYSEEAKVGQKYIKDIDNLLVKAGFYHIRTAKKSKFHADLFYSRQFATK